MIQKLYSVYDFVAREYAPVFQHRNHGTALRDFKAGVGKVPNISDYSLYCVGEIDNEKGIVKAYEKPELVEPTRETDEEVV